MLLISLTKNIGKEIVFILEARKEKKRTQLLRNKLIQNIKKSGSISFYDFMEKALYDSEEGFYSRRVLFGKKGSKDGDYLTHPNEFSPQFGQGIAKLVSQLDCANKKKGGIRRVISIAAGDGILDKDFLDWLKKNNSILYKHIEYILIDISERQIALQKQTLDQHMGKITFIRQSGLAYLRVKKGKLKNTFIYANEWLDALPVYRIIRKNGRWMEIRIKVNKKNQFYQAYEEIKNKKQIKKFLTVATQAERKFDSDAYKEYEININTQMIEIAEALSETLVSGFSLLIDYGMTEREPTQKVKIFSRNKKMQRASIFSYPGSVDMTTQIDWEIWLKASSKLQTVFITIDLVLLKYLGLLTDSDIAYTLLEQYKYPAVLQSAGGYTVSGKIQKIVREAEKESEEWFHEGWFGRVGKSPYPFDSWKTLLFCIKERWSKKLKNYILYGR